MTLGEPEKSTRESRVERHGRHVMLRSMALAVVLVSWVVLASGCGNDKSVTFKSSGMTQTFSEGAEDLPDNLKGFVYPKSSVAGSTSSHDPEGEEAMFLTLSSTDPMDRVSEWYQSNLKSQGWSIDSLDNQGRMINIYGQKDDREINVLIAEDEKKTTISVSQGKAVDDTVDEQDLEKFTPNDLTPPMD